MKRHPALITFGLAVSLLMLILGMSACGGGAPSPAPAPATPSPTPAPPPSPTPELKTPTAAPAAAPGGLKDIADAMGKVKTFRTKMTMEMAGAKTEVLTEFVLPDRQHTKFTMMGLESEVIVIKDTTWLKSGGGPWMKQPASPMTGNVDPKRALEDLAAGLKVEKGGIETVDGVRCQTYTYTSSVEGTQVPVKLYVGLDDNLPRKMEMSVQGASVVLLYYDYNVSISIEPPTT